MTSNYSKNNNKTSPSWNKTQKNKNLDPDLFTKEFHQNLKEKLPSTFSNYSIKEKKEKNTTQLLWSQYYFWQQNQRHNKTENYRLISLINMKIQEEILANWIQKSFHQIHSSYEVSFCPAMEKWFNKWNSSH